MDPGAETNIHSFKCDEQIALNRCIERNNDLDGSFEICENTHQVVKEGFERLGADGFFEFFDSSL